MATWTIKRTLASGFTPRWACSDGTTMYFADGDGNGNEVYSYVPATDTLTLILSSSITDLQRIRYLTVFKGDLYALFRMTGGSFALDIIRFDGTLDNFTVVRSLASGGLSDYCGLLSDATEMVMFGIRNLGATSPQETHHTTNGTTWNAGSFAEVAHIPSSYINFPWSYATEWPQGFFFESCAAFTGTPCDDITILNWNTIAKQWQNVVSNYLNGYRLSAPAFAQHWTETLGAEFTTNFTSFTNPDTSQRVNYQVNWPFSTSVQGSSDDIFQWDGAAWSLLDTTTGFNFIDDVDFAFAIRMSNLEVFILIPEFNLSSGFYVILERDEIIGSLAGFQHSEGGIPGLII